MNRFQIVRTLRDYGFEEKRDSRHGTLWVDSWGKHILLARPGKKDTRPDPAPVVAAPPPPPPAPAPVQQASPQASQKPPEAVISIITDPQLTDRQKIRMLQGFWEL